MKTLVLTAVTEMVDINIFLLENIIHAIYKIFDFQGKNWNQHRRLSGSRRPAEGFARKIPTLHGNRGRKVEWLDKRLHF